MIKKTDKLISALALFVLICFFAGFAIINFCGTFTFIDGDSYADMLIARRMWEQKTLFPDGWIFGNQFYVIATPVVCALFYGITGSMNLSMALATSAMSVLIVLSFVWMIKPFVTGKQSIILGFLAFVSAVIAQNGMREAVGQLFFTLASYYACYLITMFFVFGDYLRTFEDKKRRYASFVIALVLSFCTGMQSMRQMLIMALPILALEVLLMIRRAVLREKVIVWRTAVRAAAYAAAELAGYLFMLWLHIPNTTIYGSVSLETELSLSERAIDMWRAWSTVSGLIYVKHAAFSRIAILHFVFFVGMVIAAAVIIIRRRKEQPSALDCLWLLNVISILGVFAAGILFSVKVRPIYIFMWYVLEAVSVIIVLETLSITPRRICALVLCLLSVWNLNFSYGDNIKTSLEPKDKSYNEFVEWCGENNIKYLYCPWTAARIAAATDGEIIAGFHDQYYYDVVNYLNQPGIYSEQDNEQAVYAYSSHDYEALSAVLRKENCITTKIMEVDGFTIYTCSRQMMFIKGE